jgi:hypothetical protein
MRDCCSLSGKEPPPMWFSIRPGSRGRRIAHPGEATSSRRTRTAAATSGPERLEERQLLSVSNVRVLEGSSGSPPAVFRVTISPALPFNQKFTYKTFDESAKANRDYVPTSGTLTYAPNQTVMFVPVSIITILDRHPNRKFGLEVDGPLRVAYGIATIINDVHKASHVTVSNPTVHSGVNGFATPTPSPSPTPTPTPIPTTTPTSSPTTTVPTSTTTPSPTPTPSVPSVSAPSTSGLT